jgi:hypothetical protein
VAPALAPTIYPIFFRREKNLHGFYKKNFMFFKDINNHLSIFRQCYGAGAGGAATSCWSQNQNFLSGSRYANSYKIKEKTP